MKKYLLLILFCFGAYAEHPLVEEFVRALAPDLKGHSVTHPVLLLVGGMPGSGKSTLAKALQKTHDLVVISLDAVRQLLLDRGLKGMDGEWEIIQDTYQRLLRGCLKANVNILIDTNAHTERIREFEETLKEEQAVDYVLLKIGLKGSFETLLKRIRARPQQEGVHQGTEKDLRRSWQRGWNDVDYQLVIDIEKEGELSLVNSFLAPYFAQQASFAD